VQSLRSADATVKFTLDEYQRTAPLGDGTPAENLSTAMTSETVSRAIMFITDRASGKMLYQAGSGEVTSDRRGAFESTFSKLMKDLKSLLK